MSYPSMRLTQDGTGRVTIYEENGTEITFDPDPGNPGEYLPTTPRCVTTLVENGDGSWTFTRTNGGRVFDFDSAGAGSWPCRRWWVTRPWRRRWPMTAAGACSR